MEIAISGGTGFIGRPLILRLLEKGHHILLLTRDPDKGRSFENYAVESVPWDARTHGPWVGRLEELDAVINLAGESIVAKQWTPARKKLIEESRVKTTRALVEGMRSLSHPPPVLVNASAVGFYGDVPEGEVDENHPRGGDFLATLCEKWETEARQAEGLGARVVCLRTGIVLAKEGGALAKMLPPFRYFIGGPLGSGRQWFPWVHLEDVTQAILFALENPHIAGPVNLVAPEPCRMKEFCRELGRTLGRPSWIPLPAPVLRLMLGEMSEMLTTGQKAVPARLVKEGYTFKHPRLPGALRAILR